MLAHHLLIFYLLATRLYTFVAKTKVPYKTLHLKEAKCDVLIMRSCAG